MGTLIGYLMGCETECTLDYQLNTLLAKPPSFFEVGSGRVWLHIGQAKRFL